METGSKKKDLIAFNDLNKNIITQGFCTLCGACEAACPVHAIKIEENRVQYDDCSVFLDLCPICYDICPHTEPLLIETTRFLEEAPIRREALGNYRELTLAQAVEPKLREASHSGGVITALLTYALDKEIIDSAVVSETETQIPLKLRPLIGLVPDDILSAVDSKFSPSAVAKAFGNAVHNYGKTRIAFVGVPHQVLAIRKLEAWQHKIMESLKITIGLFCLWTFSLKGLLNHLSRRYGIEPSEIQRMELTEEYLIHTTKGITRIPISSINPYVLHSCRTCMDFTSELADISVGGAGPLKGWSTVIIRTKEGEDLFNDAVKNKAIKTMAMKEAPDVLTNILNIATHKRNIAFEEVKKRQKNKEPIPPAINRMLTFLPRETAILAEVKVKDAMTKDVMVADPKLTINQLLDVITEHHHIGYPVVNEYKELVGIVTFEDAAKVPKQRRNDVLVKEIASKKLISAHPEDSVLAAFKKMTEHEIGRLIIVDRNNPKKLCGILTRTDIMHTLRKSM